MAAEVKKEIALEIAHVLFTDTVAYSRLSINEQHAAVEELNEIVRASEQFQRAEAAGRLLKIATGDGMALVFQASPEARSYQTGAWHEHPYTATGRTTPPDLDFVAAALCRRVQQRTPRQSERLQ